MKASYFQWKPLLISWGVVVFLLFTFLNPWTAPVWHSIDHAIFSFLNGTLKDRPLLQYFWALVNHKRMDLVEDAIFLFFFLWALYVTPRQQRWQKASQFLAIIVFVGSIIFFVNRWLLREHVLIPRSSPTLVVDNCVHITHVIPWKGLKDQTIASFPGDHATTLLLFGFLFSAFAPSSAVSLWAWGYVVFRILPRLVVGAHWFSDIAVGSVSLALFFTACFLHTPLGRVAIAGFEKIPTLLRRKVRDGHPKNTI